MVVRSVALDFRSHGIEWQTSISAWSTQAGFEFILYFILDTYGHESAGFLRCQGRFCSAFT